jgi:hypothetical protein
VGGAPDRGGGPPLDSRRRSLLATLPSHLLQHVDCLVRWRLRRRRRIFLRKRRVELVEGPGLELEGIAEGGGEGAHRLELLDGAAESAGHQLGERHRQLGEETVVRLGETEQPVAGEAQQAAGGPRPNVVRAGIAVEEPNLAHDTAGSNVAEHHWLAERLVEDLELALLDEEEAPRRAALLEDEVPRGRRAGLEDDHQVRVLLVGQGADEVAAPGAGPPSIHFTLGLAGRIARTITIPGFVLDGDVRGQLGSRTRFNMTWLRRCAAAILVYATPVPAVTAESFPVGPGPTNLVFDGQNLWVGGSSSLTKLRESDGAFLGTFAAKATDGMTFDGTNVWWSRLARNNPSTGYCVGKTRASDGAFLGCFLTLTQPPRGLAFDGAHVWAAVENGTVVKIRASDNALVGTFPVGADPFGVVFDGANVWVSATGSGFVRKLRASNGRTSVPSPRVPFPRGWRSMAPTSGSSTSCTTR